MPVIHDGLGSVALDERTIAVYDRPIRLRLLHEEPDIGEEHYLIRYEPGTSARWHRHTAAHTIVVLEGRLSVNGRDIGPGAYCHYGAGEPMRHEPAGDGPCLFLNLFHGPSDVEALEDQPV
jgi:quercetin dioxygenase-like cupin family protein